MIVLINYQLGSIILNNKLYISKCSLKINNKNVESTQFYILD